MGRISRRGRLLANRLIGGFDWGVRAALDFLIEDACIVCRRESPGGDPPPADRRLRLLQSPIAVTFGRPFRAVNHPVCNRCARGHFVTTAHPATLATPQGDVGLVTPSGERFGPREGAPARVAPVGLHAPFMTNDALLALVHAFKFSGYRELAEPFGAAMAVVAPRVSGGGAPLLVSMPLSPGDRGRKRFNGVEALAAVCAGRLEWPMTAEVLRKRRDTARQSLTPHESRAANVRGAFECDPGPVERRRVILVDDLVTTGATATAAAVEILAAGAESVEVLCLARAL